MEFVGAAAQLGLLAWLAYSGVLGLAAWSGKDK